VSTAADHPAPRLRPPDWDAIIADHDHAVRLFLDAAAAIPAAAWDTSPAEGKWSAAEIVEHIALSYDGLVSEIRGGAAMKLRLPLWKRVLLRATVMQRLLRGHFPRNAPAPRETRPQNAPASVELGVHRLEMAFDAFRTLAMNTDVRRRARLTHPYFGGVGMAPAVRFMAVHTRHHHAQLAHRSTTDGGHP
jgi:hypothetical protein